MLQSKSIDQLKADVAQLQKALRVPNIPKDELEMHNDLIQRIRGEISRRELASTSHKEQPVTIYVGGQTIRANVESTVTPPPNATQYQTAPSRTILAGGHSKTPDPITNKIEVAQDSNRFNPTITITWSDGYQLTVDETAAISRFKSTFRDTCALKCVSEQRLNRMWRWDTPWRSSGFLKGITILRDGLAPSLKDLGYTYPTKIQSEVFTLISQHCNDNQ